MLTEIGSRAEDDDDDDSLDGDDDFADDLGNAASLINDYKSMLVVSIAVVRMLSQLCNATTYVVFFVNRTRSRCRYYNERHDADCGA